ncbi:hypothetical protein F9C07_11883 [Aspergillus flavus]|uniref:Uncharacterized protein n=1 Tax=Aspergillus flavus (strain ATCC 200026 / FGSC A1120 / IAM 13836 / NRRL 3357 / JCM 12722 / SRRC 167) TaxID=332952 RepID=A0A7U2N2N1_ASPFN|nr:hypothetical protein F9C07_11883 [Aspergillus flavus]
MSDGNRSGNVLSDYRQYLQDKSGAGSTLGLVLDLSCRKGISTRHWEAMVILLSQHHIRSGGIRSYVVHYG